MTIPFHRSAESSALSGESHYDRMVRDLESSALEPKGENDGFRDEHSRKSQLPNHTHEIDVDYYIVNATTTTSGQPAAASGGDDRAASSCAKRRTRRGSLMNNLNRRKRQSIRASVQLLAALSPHKHDHRDQVTLRVHSVWSFLTMFGGSVTEYSWPKVVAYTAYLTTVAVIFMYNCPEHVKEDDMDHLPMRCNFVHQQEKMKVEELFGLWMFFTAFLFTSFVGAGLQRFRDTLGYIRTIQGRINEISLLLHTHCRDPKDQAFAAVLRLLTALPFIMYAAPQFGHAGDDGNSEFLVQAAQYLSEDQFENLNRIPSPGDRPYAMMLWINRIILESLQRDPNCSHPPPFSDHYSSFSMRITAAVENLRGTYAALSDSLDDAILPFPFANLIIANIYIVFAGLPFAILRNLRYGLIPAGGIYFWFLDGMITFVFLVDQPFDYKVAGRKNISQPLIDLHKAIQESVAGTPRRFPTALAHQPKYRFYDSEEQRI